jgi:hypothetical protein
MRPLIEIHIASLQTGTTLPVAESHPFNVAIDTLAEAISSAPQGEAGPARARFIRSSDAPDWAEFIQIELPTDPARRLEVVTLALKYLSDARRALPGLTWKVKLGGGEAAWDAAAGFTFGPAIRKGIDE